MRLFMIAYLAAAVAHSAASGATWYVRQDGSGNAWTIFGGLALASTGDTIFVGPGIYRQPPIHLEAIHLISEEGPEATVLELWATALEEAQVIIAQDLPAPCSIIGFTIRGARNGFLSSGGGICCLRSAATIKNNIITDNWCQSAGGVYCNGPQNVLIESNLFCENGASAAAAIGISSCSPIIRFNTIANNYATDGAGAITIFGDSSFPVISNNIIVANGSSATGAVHSITSAGQITFSCNDVWNNAPANYEGTMGDQTGIRGNISQDPLFCGIPGSGNYFLRSSSPCTAANAPVFCSGLAMGRYPVNCTVGTRGATWGNIKSLFEEGKR